MIYRQFCVLNKANLKLIVICFAIGMFWWNETDVAGSSIPTQIQAILSGLPSLVAYWPLSKDFGARDAHTSQIDGTIYGSTPTWTMGPTTNANGGFMSSKASNTYISFNSSLLHFENSITPWTLTIHVNPGTGYAGQSFPIFEYNSDGVNHHSRLWQNSTFNTLFICSEDGGNPAPRREDPCIMNAGWTFVGFMANYSGHSMNSICETIINPALIWPNSADTETNLFIAHTTRYPGTHNGDAAFACAAAFSSLLSPSQLNLTKQLCSLYQSIVCSPNCVVDTCRVNLTTSTGYSCSCVTGWEGPTCTAFLCSPTCQNGGNCTGTNVCTCPANTSYSDCSCLSPAGFCQNGGTCSTNTSMTCACPSGYSGVSCSMPCSAGYCANGGSCIGANMCSCPTGYLPPNCIVPSCTANCSGHGNCTAPDTCVCYDYDEWTGSYCQKPVCPSNCNFPSRGTCTSPHNCTCYSNSGVMFYGGSACEISLCYPSCQNNGTCMTPGGNICYCPSQWMGSGCTTPATTLYVGSSDNQPDGTETWATAMLPKVFSPNDEVLATTGFDAQPAAPEHCCPCGSFIQDGNCYFVSHLPSSMPYMESKDSSSLLYNLHGCFDRGGTLATFEKGDSVEKMANVFKWLATDANIQFDNKPVDAFNASAGDLCFMVGIYRDNVDYKYYWETMPPTLVDYNLFIDGQPSGGDYDICVIPHKKWPKLRAPVWYAESQPVLCMIRNPCTQAPVCKPGKPGISWGKRLLDRCMTTGPTLDSAAVLTNHKTASDTCKTQGGTLPSVRYQFEQRYWSFSLYYSANCWDPNNWGAWIGLNHFKSDYYWNTSNKNVASPLEVDWNLAAGEPDQPSTGQCHMATANGWQDTECSLTANFACEGPLVDPSMLTTTPSQGFNIHTAVTTALPATTVLPTTTTTAPSNCSYYEGCCPCNWYRYLTTTMNICYLLVESARPFEDAQQHCTRNGGYLAIPDSQSKISFLVSKTLYQNGSYWIGLTKNNYNIWTWPNGYGANLTAELVGSTGLPTEPNYKTAVLEMTSANIVPASVNVTSYPFICEIAMTPNSCPVCRPPLDAAGLTTPTNWVNSLNLGGPLTMPLRISPDKCVWVFQETGNNNQNAATCKAAGMSPVALYHAYENKLMRNVLSYLGTSIWIDLTKRENTSFTWEGEPTTYNRWSLISQNDWKTPCMVLNGNARFEATSCENRRSPLCTIPPVSTCAEMCPFGFTAIAGSCFNVHLTKVSNPFEARDLCWSQDGTYTLASITNTAVLDSLATHLKAIKAAPGTHYWIGLDDSIRKFHNETTYANFTYFADPDGVWEMDNGELFSLTSAWDTANPVLGKNHSFAVLFYNGTSLKLRTTKVGGTITEANMARIAAEVAANASVPPATPVATPAGVPGDNFFICERSKPCLQCPIGWKFFNGHCYYVYSFPSNMYGLRVLRGFCDLYQSSPASISSPIEDKFLGKITASINDWWFGLYRTHSSNTSIKADATFYEWEDGTRLSETRYANWHNIMPYGAPDFKIGADSKSQFATTLQMSTGGWNDRDFYFTQPLGIVCEKPALIPSIQCPYQVSIGVTCGENIISPTFTYSASSSYSNGITSYPPIGIVMSAPWCHNGPFDVFPGNHWIKIDFGSVPYFVRAIATLGGQSVAGMVTAYQVQYMESYGGSSFTDLYVHKSLTGMTKMSPVTFAGNAVSNTKNSQEICPRLKAYQLKISPLHWLLMPYMRIEVKGCRSTTASVATFCECWVESFDNYVNDGKHLFWTNKATADSYISGSEPKMAAVWYEDSLYTSGLRKDYEFPGGWTPNTFGDDSNWWQVNFAVLKVVTGLVMRGNDDTNEFITSYYVKWSHTGYEYTFNDYYGIDSFPRLFAGPVSSSTVTQQSFCPPMKTIALRIIPASYSIKPTMVVDIFACMARGRRCYDCCDEIGICNCNCPVGYTGSSCATVATDRNYYIDAQAPVCESDELLTKLAGVDINHPSSGNGTNGNGSLTFSWIPLATDRQPYWQVDFKRVMSISIVKVAGNSVSYVSVYNLWFLVQNTDNSLFYPILEQQNNPESAVKAIPGARLADPNYFTPYYLCPNIRTKVLRFAPIVRNGSGIDFPMRFKIHGCPSHAPCSTCCTHSDGCQCKCPVGYSTNYGSNVIVPNPWEHCDQWALMPVDCEDYLLQQPSLSSGVYTIFPPGQSQMSVYCDMTTLGGGWTVIQNRQDNSVDFFKTWADYRNGFGSLDQNFWLGNEKIRSITSGINRYQLLIELTTADAQLGIAYYSSFFLDDEQHGYALYFDNEVCNQIGDSLLSHRGQRFYTKDNDTVGFHCASNSYGGWWYHSTGTDTTSCHDSNLNGYLVGTVGGTMATWKTWRGYYESMVTTKMLIRRSPLPNILKPLQPQYSPPLDCEDILEANPASPSGIYDIYPVAATGPVAAYCEMVALGGGWTVILRHYDSSVNFNQNWTEYTYGFGSLSRNHYLGNYWISLLTDTATTNLPYRMAAVLEDLTGEKRTATYEPFLLDSWQDFALRYWYNNPDGDNEDPGDIFLHSKGRPFQTRDHNIAPTCPLLRQSGWWFQNKTGSNCSEANLNGAYGTYTFEGGMYAAPWKGRYESLKSATMMIRRSGPKPVDCDELYDPYSPVYNTSGVYWIYPYGMEPIQVYCRFDKWTSGQPMVAYTVVQRRFSDNVAFASRTWEDYKKGFWSSGTKTSASDYWLGLETIRKMVQSRVYSARVIVKFFFGNNNSYELLNQFYEDFYVMGESERYALYVNNGTVGDAGDAFELNNLMPFSTVDNVAAGAESCVDLSLSGWWYNPNVCNKRGTSNLNSAFDVWAINGGSYWRGFYNYDNITIHRTEISLFRKALPAVRNLPHTTVTQLCPAKSIIRHDCEPMYEQKAGDQVRMMAHSRTPGIYYGTDLLCKQYLEPMDCSYFQSTAAATDKFISSTRTDLTGALTGSFTAFCDQETMGGGWTVIQRRLDDTQTFLLDVQSYDTTFGIVTANFWLGNSIIRGLTSTANYELLIEMRTNSSYGFALYDSFHLSSDVNLLHLGGSYNACSTAGDSLENSEGKAFAYDNCGSGAWWFPQTVPCAYGAGNNSFPTSNLNAPYGTQIPTSKGIYWWTYGNGFTPNFMATSMKIRRAGTRGLYVKAVNYTCDQGSSFTHNGVNETQCQDLCTRYNSFTCLSAVYERGPENCILRNGICNPGQGSATSGTDTYFRMDACTHCSHYCGPPPIMVATDMRMTEMPTRMSVNYTCVSGFNNLAFSQDWTVLVCNSTSKKWEGQWLECKSLCGNIPDLSSGNAVLTPETSTYGGTIVVYYACQPDYELIYGDLTRICAPPYGNWSGGAVMCSTTKCDPPPDVDHSTNNFTSVPLADITRRFAVWNYTCDPGYVFTGGSEGSTRWKTIKCLEDRQWYPTNLGTCAPFRCSNAPVFDYVTIAPPFSNATIFQYGARLNYTCSEDLVLDPLNWDNSVTIACVGNETWSVVDYPGANKTWLPWRCICKDYTNGFCFVVSISREPLGLRKISHNKLL